MDRLSTFFISRQSAEPDATIRVNNEKIAVNKSVLTLSSNYFQRYFSDDRNTAAESIELPESTTMEDFKRLLAILPPEEDGLDYDCLEAILILASHFAMDNVLELCRNFLMACNKPKLCKLRIAHKYGLDETEILLSMRLKDFGNNFVEDATEFAQLDDCTKAAFIARHAMIVSGNSNSAGGSSFHRRGGTAFRGGRGGGNT